MITTNVKYDTKTRLLGMLGYPLGHSVTSIVHNAMYQWGDINAVFIPMEVEDKPGNLERFFDAVDIFHVLGFSVTMPYKTRLIPFIDECPEECRVFRCINNVKITEDGRRIGVSYDGYGMGQALEEAGHSIKDKEVLILGAGGISGITAYEFVKRGASKVTILNRTAEKAEKVAQQLHDFTGIETVAGPLTKDELDHAAKNAQIVAQCTSLGLNGHDADFEYLGFVDKLPKNAVIEDAIFNPLQTSILRAGAEAGIATMNGISMLANQMSAIIEFYFGVDLGVGGKYEAASTIIRAMRDREKEARTK